MPLQFNIVYLNIPPTHLKEGGTTIFRNIKKLQLFIFLTFPELRKIQHKIHSDSIFFSNQKSKVKKIKNIQ